MTKKRERSKKVPEGDVDPLEKVISDMLNEVHENNPRLQVFNQVLREQARKKVN